MSTPLHSPWTRTLSIRDTRIFFLLATLLFILPFLLADYPYVDDHFRYQLLAQNAWREQGRLLIELFYNALTFSQGTPDIFPLPLLVATGVAAFALARLTFHYSPAPTWSHCLVALPLWYSPLFLGNLTYQYDGPAMALGMAAVVYAITWRGQSRVVAIVFPGLLLAAGISLYQVNINVFIGLVCVELIRAVGRQSSFKDVAIALGEKIAQLIVGLLVYQLTVAQLIKDKRQALLPFTSDGLHEVEQRLVQVAAKVELLFTPGNGWFCLALLAIAVLGFLLLGWRALGARVPAMQKLGLAVVYLATLPVLVLAVPGIMLVFGEFNVEARTLMGFSALLVAVFFLCNSVLGVRGSYLLAIPLLCMLSFSFAYGRVLSAQKALEQTILHELSHDIDTNKALQDADVLYLLTSDDAVSWLPPASRTLTAMPALRYILSLDFFVLPEMFPSVGITNIYWGDDKAFAASQADGKLIQVANTRFYSLYVVDHQGYIVMKKITAAEAYEE